MSASFLSYLSQWVVAPLGAMAIGYGLSSEPSAPQPTDPLPPTQQEAVDATKSAMASWRHARALTEPLLRIQASWAAIEASDRQQQEALFRRALEDQDHEGLAMLGETWLARDPMGFIEALADVPIRGSSPPVFQLQLDRAFRVWMKTDPKKAFQAFLKRDDQSQLFEGSSDGRSLGGEFLVSCLSKDPEAVKDLDLTVSAHRMNDCASGVTFSGDVEALAHGLSQRSLDDVLTKGLLEFFQRAIRTDDPTEETHQRILTWWRALPEAMQVHTIPWDAGPELLDHPGLQKWLAQRAMDDLGEMPVYMWHYGKAWAAENPQEALEWVLEHYREQPLTGPPFLLTPEPLTSSRIRMNFDNLGQDSVSFYDAVSIPILSMVANDPQQAIDALEALPYPYTRSRMAPVIAEEWAKSDREAALEWSKTLPGTFARQRAQDNIEGKSSGSGYFIGSFDVSP